MLLTPDTPAATPQPVRFAAIAPEAFAAILIDLDDTLYRYAPCHAAGLAAAHAVDPLGLDMGAYAARYRAARDAVTARLAGQGACRSRLLAFQRMAEDLGIARAAARALTLDEAYWAAFIAAMVPHPAAVAFLARCADAAVPLCLVTDMTAAVQIRKIARLGLADTIAHLVTSEEIGAEKPDPRLFHAGLAKLGATPARALMLGDSVEKDVRGALACGITAGLIDLGGNGE